jgi:hypothetical protein
MNREEARQKLAMLRSDEHDRSDPFFADALAFAASDPELKEWLAREQEFDRVFAEKVNMIHPPAGLRERIAPSSGRHSDHRELWWWRRVALAAAAIIVVALILISQRHHRPALDDFRSEMLSFIKLTPPLELESADLDRIEKWTAHAEAPQPPKSAIPAGLKALVPAGCRVLSFHGYKVTLICFKRGNGKLAHLLVVDRAALPGLPDKNLPAFEPEADWMTAAWQNGGYAYVLAAQGDRGLLDRYLARL